MLEFTDLIKQAKDEVARLEWARDEAIGILQKITYKTTANPTDMLELSRCLKILQGIKT